MPDGGDENSSTLGEDVELSQLALDEVRLRYQEEKERRNSVESKIGTILTVDAIIVSIVGLFQNMSWLLVLAMAAALLSVLLGIYGLRVQDYLTPGKDVDDYLQYIDDPPEPARRELLKSYMTSITGNEETDDPELFTKGNRTKNNEKFSILTRSQYLTAASLALVLLHTLLSQAHFTVQAILNGVYLCLYVSPAYWNHFTLFQNQSQLMYWSIRSES